MKSLFKRYFFFREIVINNTRPSFNFQILECYKNLIESCWSQDTLKRPSFEQIVDSIKNNLEFLLDDVDDGIFSYYIYNIDEMISKQNKKLKNKKYQSEKDEKETDELETKENVNGNSESSDKHNTKATQNEFNKRNQIVEKNSDSSDKRNTEVAKNESSERHQIVEKISESSKEQNDDGMENALNDQKKVVEIPESSGEQNKYSDKKIVDDVSDSQNQAEEMLKSNPTNNQQQNKKEADKPEGGYCEIF